MIEPNIPASVLIVDDNPAKLIALAAALEGVDIEIVTANSGVEALHQLLQQDFAAVLLDVNMPDMSGFETATMIRNRPRFAHLPILFITSEAITDESRIKGYELGAVDYLLSPVLPLILRSKVSTFTDLYRLRARSFRYVDEMLTKNEEIARQNIELQERSLLKEIQRISRMGSFTWDIPAGQWQSSAELDVLFGIDESYERSLASWEALIHPDDRAQIVDYIKNAALGQGHALDKECRIIRHDERTECWVRIMGQLELSPEGLPLKLRGTIQDISESKRLREELEVARQREQEMRELASMERISGGSSSSITAQAFGMQPLREMAPDFFAILVQRFGRILDMALEQRVLRVDHPIQRELQDMADQLGVVKAGPRDTIDICLRALKESGRDISPQKAQAYAEENRLLVLELMGNLVFFYRRHSVGPIRRQAAVSNPSIESNCK